MSYFEIKTKYGVTFIQAQQKGGGKRMYWLTGIAGIILMVAPYVFSYVDNQAAFWTSVIAGTIVAFASLWEGFQSRQENWEYWTVGIVGLLAILAPFALGFGSYQTAMWTVVIMGAIIAVLGFGKLWNGSMPSSI